MNKQQQRLLLKERLSRLKNREEASERICEKLKALVEERKDNVILSYCPTEDEADVQPFNRWAEDRGLIVAYPVCVGKQLEAYAGGYPFLLNKYGIEEPDTESGQRIDVRRIELVVVPCVGYDKVGHRLGHGEGYYDRFLQECDGYRCLVGFKQQQLDEICTDEHDIQMERIINEE